MPVGAGLGRTSVLRGGAGWEWVLAPVGGAAYALRRAREVEGGYEFPVRRRWLWLVGAILALFVPNMATGSMSCRGSGSQTCIDRSGAFVVLLIVAMAAVYLGFEWWSRRRP